MAQQAGRGVHSPRAGWFTLSFPFCKGTTPLLCRAVFSIEWWQSALEGQGRVVRLPWHLGFGDLFPPTRP